MRVAQVTASGDRPQRAIPARSAAKQLLIERWGASASGARGRGNASARDEDDDEDDDIGVTTIELASASSTWRALASRSEQT